MQITINEGARKLDVPVDMPLLWVLRDVLGMTGTKFGCGMGCAVRARCISTVNKANPTDSDIDARSPDR